MSNLPKPDIVALRFLFGGVIRNAIVRVPANWRRAIQDRAADPSVVHPGMRVILVVGHKAADLAGLVEDGGSDLQNNILAQDAILIFADPVSVDGQEHWWASGHAGPYPNLFEIDDVAFIAHLLHKLRTELQARYDAYIVEVPDTPPAVVLDPTRLFAIGWSSGGMMCYRLAAERTLADPAAPDHLYRFAAMAVFSATAGGYREGIAIGVPALLTLNQPAYPSRCCTSAHWETPWSRTRRAASRRLISLPARHSPRTGVSSRCSRG